LFEEILKSETGNLLTKTKDTFPAEILFYCFAHDYGKEVIAYERETVELLLGNNGYSYRHVEKIVNMIAIIQQMDRVMSTSDGFLYSNVVLNDLGGMAENIESVSVEHMIWTIIMLMSIFGAENNPLIADAIRTVAAKLMDEGWTTPPVVLPSHKLFDLMPYADRNLPIMAEKHKDRFLHINNPEIRINIDNQYDNYFEMHKDLLYYLEQEDSKYEHLIEGIIS